MQPIIAIECGHYTDGGRGRFQASENIVAAVERAGGVPLLLAPSAEADLNRLLQHTGGVILTGGDDYAAEPFGRPPQPMVVENTPRRAAFARRLALHVIERRVPFLAICLGAQTVNLARGGSLIFDLPDELPDSPVAHRRALRPPYPRHSASVLADSFFSRIWGRETIIINSSHHQAVKQPGADCRVGLRAPDGVIEGFELEGHPFGIGVQWHPEELLDEPEQLLIFQELIQEAARHVRTALP